MFDATLSAVVTYYNSYRCEYLPLSIDDSHACSKLAWVQLQDPFSYEQDTAQFSNLKSYIALGT